MVVSSRFCEATGGVAGVQQREAAGAVGRFQHARLETGLPDASPPAGRRRRPGSGWPRPKRSASGDAEIGGAIAHLGQHLHRDVEQVADVGSPAALVDVVEQRARGVGGVGDVRLAAGQLPDQPAVDGAEQQLAVSAPRPCAVDVVEDPFQLGAGEIGIEQQAGAVRSPSARARRRAVRGRNRRCGGPARRWRCGPACRSRGPRPRVVSRWLVMPMAAISAAVTPALSSAARQVDSTVVPEVVGGRVRPSPRPGKCCANSSCAEATTAIAPSNTMRAAGGGALVDGKYMGHGGS